MARSFTAALVSAARASDRARRANIRQQAAYQRALEREQRANARAARQYYLEGRADEVDDLNEELRDLNDRLEGLLLDSLDADPTVQFSSLRKQADLSQISPELKYIRKPDQSEFKPQPLNFIEKMLPSASAKQAEHEADAQRRYAVASKEHAELVVRRQAAIDTIQEAVFVHNLEIDEFEAGVEAGEAEAVKTYFDLVLAASEYPDSFPDNVRVGYLAESKQLIVDVQMPSLAEAIPTVEKYSFVKSADEIRQKLRTDRSRKAQYSDVIAKMALRFLNEVFTVSRSNLVDSVAFSGFVIANDPSTGREVRPYLVSVRIDRETFSALELRTVEPIACLKRLNAHVSRSPAELVAIKPIVDINMADPRFVDEQDVLSMLDTRPNLMELTPGEFESLITNLFQSMGLETKLTQASRDGGVDCVAFDPRPVLGGKVIVQAKRYKNTVGVSAVRDLFGTMHNEGASKGILVTTSGYGKAAFTFADGKPIELLSGSNLLFLLKEHAGVDAKIEVPDGWSDPVLDVSS